MQIKTCIEKVEVTQYSGSSAADMILIGMTWKWSVTAEVSGCNYLPAMREGYATSEEEAKSDVRTAILEVMARLGTASEASKAALAEQRRTRELENAKSSLSSAYTALNKANEEIATMKKALAALTAQSPAPVVSPAPEDIL